MKVLRKDPVYTVGSFFIFESNEPSAMLARGFGKFYEGCYAPVVYGQH